LPIDRDSADGTNAFLPTAAETGDFAMQISIGRTDLWESHPPRGMTCNRLALAFALALAFLSVILGAAEDLLFLSVIPEGNLLQTALNLAKTPQNA
jgi:hypothetical protein